MFEHGMYGFAMVFIWVLPLLLVAAIIYYAKSSKKELLSAKEILDRRYASGEIDTDEYNRRLKELRSSEKK